MSASATPNLFQQAGLIALRTLIGWHLAWEGLVRLLRPSWSRAGWPLPPWSAATHLREATGPFAEFFHGLADSGWMGVVDLLVPILLLLTGLLLMLGLFTRTASASALLLLLLSYALSVPTGGVKVPGMEGHYLYVDKSLVEAAAVLVLLTFDTGRIAGLDLLLRRRRPDAGLEGPATDEPTDPATEAAT